MVWVLDKDDTQGCGPGATRACERESGARGRPCDGHGDDGDDHDDDDAPKDPAAAGGGCGPNRERSVSEHSRTGGAPHGGACGRRPRGRTHGRWHTHASVMWQKLAAPHWARGERQ